MRLTDEQLYRVQVELKEKGLRYYPVEDELIDDVASSIEVLMEQGVTFEEAFEKISKQISHQDIEMIQKNIIHTLRTNRSLKHFEKRRALFLMLSLAAWVILEYAIGRLTGVKELGPVYGLLSVILIIYWVHYSLKIIVARYFENFASFRNILLAGTKLSLFSSMLFSAWLLLFWTYIYPDFAESFQMNPAERLYTSGQLLVSSVLAAGFATFFLGTAVSFFSAIRLKSSGS